MHLSWKLQLPWGGALAANGVSWMQKFVYAFQDFRGRSLADTGVTKLELGNEFNKKRECSH
jgi:hypothetical protein